MLRIRGGSAAAAAGTATSATEPAGRSACGPAQAANANAIHGNTCLNRIIASHPLLRACSLPVMVRRCSAVEPSVSMQGARQDGRHGHFAADHRAGIEVVEARTA